MPSECSKRKALGAPTPLLALANNGQRPNAIRIAGKMQ